MGCLLALLLLIPTIPILAAPDHVRMATWDLILMPAAGLALLVASAFSLYRSRAGAFGAAFISAGLLVYSAIGWIVDPSAPRPELSMWELRLVVALAVLPEFLILLLAVCLVSNTMKIGKRRTELAETGGTYEQDT